MQIFLFLFAPTRSIEFLDWYFDLWAEVHLCRGVLLFFIGTHCFSESCSSTSLLLPKFLLGVAWARSRGGHLILFSLYRETFARLPLVRIFVKLCAHYRGLYCARILYLGFLAACLCGDYVFSIKVLVRS